MTGAYRFGPIIGRNDVTFRLWAPGAKNVTLLCDDRQATDRSEDGWFTKTMPGVPPGTHYKFRIDDEIDVNDPASRFQPNDVHGPSELIDPAYDWQARGWKGRRIPEHRNLASVHRAAGRSAAKSIVVSFGPLCAARAFP